MINPRIGILRSVLASALFLGCRGEAPATAGALPAAEFLFAAGDSTYWVRSSSEGMRVRSAPILLTQVDGAMHEVFLTDDGAEYPDASFATVRLWARPLASRDSVLLFADSTVLRELAGWRRRHPREEEIDPADDDAPDDPRTVVQDDIELLDVHGPYLTFEHLLNVDLDGGPPHQHAGRRFVVDVRSGYRPSLGDLVGAPEAARVLRTAKASLTQLTDSIRAAGQTGDERARAALETLASFRFDSTSFGLTDIARDPAVTFMVPGRGTEGDALALNLPPIAVAEPVWWRPVRATLPEWSDDSTRVRWTRGTYDVLARPSADGEALALVLVGKRSLGQTPEWPVATVVPPAYQLIALESPPLDSAGRAALARAFDASTAFDGVMQRAGRLAVPAPPVAPVKRVRYDGPSGGNVTRVPPR